MWGERQEMRRAHRKGRNAVRVLTVVMVVYLTGFLRTSQKHVLEKESCQGRPVSFMTRPPPTYRCLAWKRSWKEDAGETVQTDMRG